MFGLTKKCYFVTMTIFSCNVSNVNSLECGSMNNQECRARPETINTGSNEPLFYPYSIKTNKCSGICTDIKDPYTNLCVPGVVKGINVKVFNLMWRTIETRYIGWHKTRECKCRLNASASHNKQRCNKDKCRCECKEIIDKGSSDKRFIWNPSRCDYECDKSCDVGEYLDYKNCKCRKWLIDKLGEECSENIDGNEMIYNGVFNDYKEVYSSCTVYIVLFNSKHKY